uniref:Peptidase M48 domain-containing protein n=1 Tax=Moniliophthora roreri TaxID=221103 RepID=A0A0W0EZN5_MONRR
MLRQVARRTPSYLRKTPARYYSSTSSIPRLHQLYPSQYQCRGSSLIQVEPHHASPLAPYTRRSGFHSSAPTRGPLPLLALLKASTALEIARTAGRIVLTFVPIILLKNHKSRRYLKHAELIGKPASEEKREQVLKRIRQRTIFFHILLAIPVTLFWATVIASMERTPLTGRWRLIVLSPDEEDEIAAALAGPGWYNSVTDILAQDGPVRFIHPTDWRYIWVRDTLRHLESTIPVLMRESELCPEWLASSPQDRPLPPPAEYPLRPRPRGMEYMRWFCDKMCDREKTPLPHSQHSIPGPPYSLLLVERPDALNAFSYGFGPDGGGGIVVYSGFLDDIFSRIPPDSTVATPTAPQSWWSQLFGGLYSSTSSQPHPTPSKQQTTELAILLAHELAHLILAHHLETLSSGTVMIPGTLSVISDVLRVLIFPVTMLFGPFINDGNHCPVGMKQEIEADVVSARLLAHAGFDARDAISFWEQRASAMTECAHAEAMEPGYPEEKLSKGEGLARRIMGSGHPVNEVRVEKLKSELVRWETERRAALLRLKNGPQQSHINLTAA